MPQKLKLIAGPCAIESRQLSIEIAATIKEICDKLSIDFVFKGSYRKANRSKLDSFRGIGDLAALEILRDIGKEFQVPTITDVHESIEPPKVAEYVDQIQIPAFLCRQTDLLIAAGKTGLPINIKKGQFLAPESMKFAIEKVQSTGNKNAMVCERGTTFGYSDLVVDSTAITRLRQLDVPVIMDCTHAVQKPNQTEGVTGGNPEMIEALALAAAANGVDGLFIETHPDPASALSDPYTMLQLDKLETILKKVIKIRKALGYE